MRKLFLLPFLFVIFAGSVFATAATTNGATANGPTDTSKSILVTKDQPTFSIKLRSNPTTGYSWLLKGMDYNIVTLVNKTYHAPGTKMVGAPGYEEWTFRAKPAAFAAPHVTTITLIYARPWDLDSVQTQGVTFKVVTYDH